MVQWLRIHLSTKGTWIQNLVQEDSARLGTTKPVRLCTTAQDAHSRQSWCSATGAAAATRSPCAATRQQSPPGATAESPHTATKTQYTKNKMKPLKKTPKLLELIQIFSKGCTRLTNRNKLYFHMLALNNFKIRKQIPFTMTSNRKKIFRKTVN